MGKHLGELAACGVFKYEVSMGACRSTRPAHSGSWFTACVIKMGTKGPLYHLCSCISGVGLEAKETRDRVGQAKRDGDACKRIAERRRWAGRRCVSRIY